MQIECARREERVVSRAAPVARFLYEKNVKIRRSRVKNGPAQTDIWFQRLSLSAARGP